MPAGTTPQPNEAADVAEERAETENGSAVTDATSTYLTIAALAAVGLIAGLAAAGSEMFLDELSFWPQAATHVAVALGMVFIATVLVRRDAARRFAWALAVARGEDPEIAEVPSDFAAGLERLMAEIRVGGSDLEVMRADLQAARDRLKNFADVSSDWLWETDENLRFVYASNRFYQVSGRKHEDIIGKRYETLYEGAIDDWEWISHISDLHAHLPLHDFSFEVSHPDGRKRWFRLNGQPLFLDDGRFAGYRGTGTDLTAVLQAREEAVETTLRFLDAIENVSNGIAFWDPNDRFVLCNRIFRAQAGAAGEKLLRGNRYEDYLEGLLDSGTVRITPDQHENWLMRRLEEHRNPGPPIEVFRDGRWLLIRDSVSSDGSTVTVTTDITDVKAQDQRLQQLTDAVPFLLAYIDRTEHCRIVNQEFAAWFGAERRDAKDASLHRIIGEESYRGLAPLIKNALAGRNIRFQASLPHGGDPGDTPEERQLDISFTPNAGEDGAVVGVFMAAVDITEQIRAQRGLRAGERALIEQTRILTASFDTIDLGITVWDENFRLVAWNQTYARLLGHPEEMMVRGEHVREFIVESAGRGFFGEGAPRKVGEERFRRLAKDELVGTETFTMPDGRIVEFQRNPMPEGGYVETVSDITERVEAEAQLQHSQKMEAIGQLTGGIAHDFNNLLAIVMGSLNLLEDRVEAETQRKLVASALRASRRGAELTRRLLAFGRRQDLVSEVIDVNELISGLIDLLQRTLGLSIEIETGLSDDIWKTQADRSQLENTVINLAINARDAMGGDGTLLIETSNIILDRHYTEHHEDLEPGAYVMISVSDTGSGIPPELIERVIEPFFTTKETGAGSGLGLSMIYGFVKQSGGQMRIYSEVGHGTVVRVYLPADDSAVEQVQETAMMATVTGVARGERILVIEDDPDVRATTVGMLTDLGYRTVEAANADQAMAALADGDGVDLVFTDVFLHGSKNGPEIARDIRATNPEIPILFTSGYTANQFQNSDILDESVQILHKPYERAVLAGKIREALGDGGAAGNA